jgi:hypothetical protein
MSVSQLLKIRNANLDRLSPKADRPWTDPREPFTKTNLAKPVIVSRGAAFVCRAADLERREGTISMEGAQILVRRPCTSDQRAHFWRWAG